jgi:putative Mg2+ transporter-C (MgtC) family protein
MLTVDAATIDAMRELLVERLEAAKYPVGDVEVIVRAEGAVEIVATLVSTAVDAKELDAVAAELARRPGVRHATWDVRTKD